MTLLQSDPQAARLLQRHHEVLGQSALGSRLHDWALHGSQHLTLSADERALWLGCLWQAMDDLELAVPLRERLWNWLEPHSMTMVSGDNAQLPVRRYPFHWVLRSKRYPALAQCGR